MSPAELGRLRDVYRDGLLNDTLPFWLKHGSDREYGGFYASLDRDGTILDTDKGIWMQGRFAWVLAHLHNTVGPNDEWLALAEAALDFLERFGTDPADGLMYFQVTGDGRPLRKRRYRFSEASACIANAAVYQATGDSRRGQKALDLFRTFRRHQQDPSLSPFPPKFTGTRPSRAIGAPMIVVNMAQICRAAGIEGDWDAEIDECLAEIASDFVHDDIECVMETVRSDGSRIDDHFDGRTLNPGHAIETAWFILDEAKHRGNDPDLIRLGTKMVEWMWRRGWDKEYGGILYFVGVDGKPVQEYWHDMKFGWPQNETVIATLLAWTLTGEEKFAEMHRQVHDWGYARFPDPEFGEWFGFLHRDGRLSSPVKGNLWKGPFHLPRMQWKCWQLCDEALEDSDRN